MVNLSLIDAAISLVAVYVAFSLLASWIQEQIATILQLRGNMLLNAITQLVGNAQLRDSLYAHPSIDAPTDTKSKRNPSFISAEQFTTALVGVLSVGKIATAAIPLDVNDLRTSLKPFLPESNKLETQLVSIWNRAQGDWKVFTAGVGGWYNDEMDRVTGWYKRRALWILLGLSLLLAGAFNVDTLQLIKSFATNPITIASPMTIDSVSQAAFANVSLGWSGSWCTSDPSTNKDSLLRCGPDTPASVFEKCVGILLTTFALLLGGPFWFDVLKQLINVRSVGVKPKPEA